MRIGLVGAGLMGRGIGLNLLRKGYGLTVLAHRKREVVDELVAHGAREAASPADLAGASEVVMLCLPGSDQVEAMVTALLPGLCRDSIIVDTSTSDPSSSLALAARLKASGIHFADTPMAGGPEQAMAGETGVLVGAEMEVFNRIKPVLSCFASRIAHMGGPGRGHAAKLVSNYLVTGMIALIADCFATAKAAGLDAAKLYDVMLAGSGNSGALRKMAGPALEGDFNGYRFALANAAKDINYFLKMAEGLHSDSELAKVVQAFFAREANKGDPQRNVSELLKGSIP